MVVAICVAGGLLAGIVAALATVGLPGRLNGISHPPEVRVPPPAVPPRPLEEGQPMEIPVVYPRRALIVAVCNYFYASPIAYADAHGPTTDLVERLGQTLHVDPGQVAQLSDVGLHPMPPLREVIQGSIASFLDSSRPQDRILVLFVGHATMIGNEAYLVPIEGELGEKGTLVPLRWLYDRLASCKARQKVLIIDVCRLDPSRGLERPGAGPMPARLDALLGQPPPGVQVWASCTQGQYSYEADFLTADGGSARAGVFLGELGEALGPFARRSDLLGQGPEDPLPVGALDQGTDGRKGVSRATQERAAALCKARQTPRLSGSERPAGTAFDPNAALPPRVTVAPLPVPAGGAAPAALIEAIFQETGAAAGREGELAFRAASLPPFAARAMVPYRDDHVSAALREAVDRANRLLKKYGRSFEEEFRGLGDTAAEKKRILARQREPARALAELKDSLEELDAASKDLDRQSVRWQATAEYVRARLKARIAYTYEYDYMLGLIRKEALPPRDPSRHDGWRLAARDKLQSGPEAKRYAKEARTALDQLARKCKGTPWEVLARRQAVTTLGLEWQPIPR